MHGTVQTALGDSSLNSTLCGINGSFPKSVIAVEALQSRRLWTLKFSSALRSLITTGGARQTYESRTKALFEGVARKQGGISRFEESAWSRIFGPHARIDRALPWQNPSEKRNPVLHSAFREGWEPKTRATANIWNVRRAASSSVQSLRKPVTLFG